MRPAGAAQIGRLCPRRGRDRCARCATIVRSAGGAVIATAELYDRMEATTEAGPPNFALAEYKAPENYPADACPMCKAGLPITTF